MLELGMGTGSIAVQEMCLTVTKMIQVMKNGLYITQVDSLLQVWERISHLRVDVHSESFARLMDWLNRLTLKIVLHGDWKTNKHATDHSGMKLLDEINKCALFLHNANNSILSLQCKKLAEVVRDPWGNENLMRILSGSYTVVDHQAVEFFRIESGYLICIRLEQLCECNFDKLALHLVTVFVKCHRLSEVENLFLNANLNQIRYCYDVYIALLFKFKKYREIISILKLLTLAEGLELTIRFTKKRANGLKIWENSREIAHLVSTEYVCEIVGKSPDSGVDKLEVFIEIWLSVTNITSEVSIKQFEEHIRKIMISAESATVLYPFSDLVFKKFGNQMKTFVIELYVRALTTDMNVMEREKNDNETEKVASTAQRLANGFLRLADVLNDHVKASRECVLTSFSLFPTKISFDKITHLAVRSGCEPIDSWSCKYHPPADGPGGELVCKECGEHVSEVKKTFTHINTALGEALNADEIGITPELCDDLIVLLSCSRYQYLNWVVPWRDLYRLCVIYLNDAEGTKNFVKDLKYLEIDYSLFSPVSGDPEKNDRWIYLPHVIDSLSSGKQIVAPTETPLLQPYCLKSKPAALNKLRQFRRTTKRARSPPLENKQLERVYLHSSSASSPCSDSWSDCSPKTSDVFAYGAFSSNSSSEFATEKNAELDCGTAPQPLDVETPIDYSVKSHSDQDDDNPNKRKKTSGGS